MENPSSTLQELIPFAISSSDIRGLGNEDARRGSGAYGAVYAVVVRGTSRIAKRLHNILVEADVFPSDKPGIRERFLNECLLLSKLDHPNVVKFVGVHFSPEDRLDVTLIMERLQMDLDKFLDPDQRPDIDTYTKLSILLDVSSGLLYLHTQLAKPIIHRDLTATNVLLTDDLKQAKIADLGVSKLIVDHLSRVVNRTTCPGTPAYMPPEALTEKPKYDTPLDVFSFGQLSLYVALQQFPEVVFELPPDQSIRAYQLGEVAILKRKKWLNMLPEDHCLRGLILSCLRDDPSERPSTERLNVKMKVLCGLELEKFEIKDVMGIIDGELYGSYITVYKVVARGAPRIAKRLNSILDFELLSDTSSSERQCIRERFYSECLALSKLDHPNILKFIGIHFNPEDRSDMSVIFERLHVSLEEFLNSQEFPDIHLNTKLSILYDISCGLLYLHTQLELPFIHGELTAANVLLNEDLRQAKIADLGVLKLRDSYANEEPRNCRALAYLPPETFSDNPKYATPIDIFSFGHLALYIALQQFPDISKEEILKVTRKKREIEILRRKKWIDELKQDHCLRELILRCLKDEPEKRPTAREVNSIMSTLNNAINPERKTKVRTLSFVLTIILYYRINSRKF
jgi:serine/threonine protein kinase